MDIDDVSDTLARVTQAIHELLPKNFRAEPITASTEFASLRIDSLVWVILLHHLEESFDVPLLSPPERHTHIKKVGDLIRLIEENRRFSRCQDGSKSS